MMAIYFLCRIYDARVVYFENLIAELLVDFKMVMKIFEIAEFA